MLQLCRCHNFCCCCISCAILSANRQHALPLLRVATCCCSCKHAFAVATSTIQDAVQQPTPATLQLLLLRAPTHLAATHPVYRFISRLWCWRGSIGRLQYTGRAVQPRLLHDVLNKQASCFKEKRASCTDTHPPYNPSAGASQNLLVPRVRQCRVVQQTQIQATK